MKKKEFKINSKNTLDWMVDYFNELNKYPVKSKVKPRDIFNKIPKIPPKKGQNFSVILDDFKNIILPGMTHWQHPNFHAFFPANNSYPSILAEMIISTIGAQCMIWETSPAAAELEEKVIDWLKNEMGIPKNWSGVINDTASSGTLTSLLTAREVISNYTVNKKGLNNNNFIVYTSKEAHSSVEKAIKIIGIGKNNLIKIDTNDDLSMNTKDLEYKIKKDIDLNKTPLAIISTFGTTGTVSLDPINKISLIAKKYNIWHHIDAAYAGSALIIKKYQKHIKNIHLADSFLFNPHKWMLTNFDCSIYFVKNKEALIKTFEIFPEYLKTKSKNVNNYKDWGIQLGRRFRSLKLWFVIRSYGIDGIKKILKKHIKLAKLINEKIEKSYDFEITAKRNFNMVNFRFKPIKINDENKLDILNKKLLKKLNNSGKVYLSHTKINSVFSLRMPIGNTLSKKKHVLSSWNLIKNTARSI